MTLEEVKRFHTIQDDIDLKPQIINPYPYYHRVTILYE